jgi:hypothetical protein
VRTGIILVNGIIGQRGSEAAREDTPSEKAGHENDQILILAKKRKSVFV